jgi:hypothetical protein
VVAKAEVQQLQLPGRETACGGAVELELRVTCDVQKTHDCVLEVFVATWHGGGIGDMPGECSVIEFAASPKVATHVPRNYSRA